MNNKTFRENAVRHGEITFKPIDELPKEAKLESENTKNYVAGHSESGHNHLVGLADVFTTPATEENPIRRFLKINTDTIIKHQKQGKHKHQTMKLFKGFYEIIEKVAYNPFKKLREKVRD